MDGVLIDAKDWHYDSLNMALAELGYKPISFKDHVETFCGLSTNKKIEMMSQNNPSIMQDRQKINDLKQIYTYKIAKERLKPNILQIQMLQTLKNKGYQLAVCSNSISATISLFLNLAQIDKFFTFTISNEDVTNQKPHPDMYLKAIANFNLQPKNCLIIEDSPYGIQAAKASGAIVMEVKTIEDVNIENIEKHILNASYN